MPVSIVSEPLQVLPYSHYAKHNQLARKQISKSIPLTEVVIHVGPGKCGSSSIQHFFNTQPDPSQERISFVHLKPAIAGQLNVPQPGSIVQREFLELIKDNVGQHDCLIISHEILFKLPMAVQTICRLLYNQVERIRCVGFSRRQSEFVASAYGQWWFRAVERVKEVNDVLLQEGLQPEWFTGLEKQFIASVVNDFYSARQLSGELILDWHNSYCNLEQEVESFNGSIHCGVLPNARTQHSLVSEFCKMTGLIVRCNDTDDNVRNERYDPELIEAIHTAVSLGLTMPGPHAGNRLLKSLSRLKSDGPGLPCNQEFLGALKAYTDSYFLESNHRLCEKFGLDSGYFLPDKKLGKNQMLEVIHRENNVRAKNALIRVRSIQSLSAKLSKLLLESHRLDQQASK